MGEITEYAMSTISQAQRKLEIIGQNLANSATPAYKKRVAFSTLLQNDSNVPNIPQVKVDIDRRVGKIVNTGNPADIALKGPGFFAFRREDQVTYSRNGQLIVDGDGRLVDQAGFALQMVNGSDVIVTRDDFQISADGTLRDNGGISGKIAVFAPLGDDRVDGVSTELLDNPSIAQGVIESSNVVSGDEMVALVEALRRAESGQRVMAVYDELLGRVITTFGDSAR